jgi:arginyl-tRNA synthetase
MHVAKWLWYYTKREKSSPPADRQELERWIAGIYVKAIQTLEEHPEFQDEVNEILLQVDKREEGPLFDVYKKTREWSIEAFNVIYQELSAHFDAWFFESQVEERGKELSRELVRKGVAKVDKGATIIDLTDRNLGVLVLLRTDGTALYGAKDLALAEKKYEMFKIEKSVHVIGAAQGMYMQQLFVALHSLAFPQEDYHLSFTEVRLPTGKMSSRTGQNLLYSDIKKEVLSYAVEEVSKHHPDWAQERMLGVARDVTIAALKWDMLNIHPNKAIVFDAKEATRFEGETGPYLQYTHARGCSILEKTTNAPGGDGELLTHEKEQAVLRLLEAFPATVDRAAREYAPGIVAHFAMDLAKAFNSFYHDCPVLGAQDEALRADRIALVRAAIGVLGAALGLLAIAAPQEM